MNDTEHLEHAIRLAIQLHRQLSEHVSHQRVLFDENRLDGMGVEIQNGKRIEQEIQKANETVALLLGSLETGGDLINEDRKKHLTVLLNSLRESIKDTMSVIEQTRNVLKSLKRETADEIRTIDLRKQAIVSYGRNAVSTHHRGMTCQ